MAPRKQRSKVGTTRMHAALDAMRSFGFAPVAVRKSVNNLLKVYGGDEGWCFIEESAYSLLIDTLLEKPESAPENKLEEGSSQAAHEMPEFEPVQENMLEKGSLQGAHEMSEFEPEQENMLEKGSSQGAHEMSEFEPEQENMLEDGSSQGANEKQEMVLESSDKMVVFPGESSGIKLEGGGEKKCLEIVEAGPMILKDNSPKTDVGFPLALYASPSSSKAVKPCYGWIDDDDEDDEFMHMTPAKGLKG